MHKLNLIILFIACAASVHQVASMSRWFSASFQDLKFTLRRYGHCVSELSPIKDYSLNETDYLIHQIRVFLDQGNYDNEQLANVTSLMDTICRIDVETSYAISVHIDVNKYNGTAGKENRCRAIDEALDPMFHLFRRASLNRSEPLDFSVIQYYPDANDKTASYNVTDLINTSWIKSETILEQVCKITGAVKEYVLSRSSSSASQKRSDQQGVLNSLVEFLNRLLDPILGLQKRFYWEGTNRFEQFQSRINYGFGSLRDGIGSRVKSTRDRVSNLFVSTTSNSTRLATNSTSMSANSTQATALNSSIALNSAPRVVNQTVPLNGTTSGSNSSSSSSSNNNNRQVATTNSQ